MNNNSETMYILLWTAQAAALFIPYMLFVVLFQEIYYIFAIIYISWLIYTMIYNILPVTSLMGFDNNHQLKNS